MTTIASSPGEREEKKGNRLKQVLRCDSWLDDTGRGSDKVQLRGPLILGSSDSDRRGMDRRKMAFIMLRQRQLLPGASCSLNDSQPSASDSVPGVERSTIAQTPLLSP